MSTDGHCTKWRRKITKKFQPAEYCRAHIRYRRQTDRHTTNGCATAYSEREREFKFVKNYEIKILVV